VEYRLVTSRRPPDHQHQPQRVPHRPPGQDNAFDRQGAAVESVGWSPDGTRVATEDHDGILRVWSDQDQCWSPAARSPEELRLTGLHPGVTVDQVRAATGWELEVADDLTVVEPPTDAELRLLRDTVDTDRIHLR
jgi:WD40 repeat protein